ncbi:MAG: ABC transporter permease subunit [Spirochaetaceae bacterium]
MADYAVQPTTLMTTKKSVLLKRIYKDRFLLILFLPTFLYFFIFKYLPMWGIIISLKDFKPFLGFKASEFVGLKHYIAFFSSPDSFKIIKNTMLLGLFSLVWGFPLPIIFALVLNEVKTLKFKKFVQTVTYMPHFLSHVVIVGMMMSFLSPIRGPINILIESLGGPKMDFFTQPQLFRTLYIASDIWQQLGWGAIIYLAALAGIDPQLYEAARMDGAGKLRQIWSITLPCIAPTIITMLLLRSGAIFSVGFEKVILMYNPAIYDTADVISTYAYRQGLVSGNISYATAIGLFNSLLNLTLLTITNKLAKKTTGTSLW